VAALVYFYKKFLGLMGLAFLFLQKNNNNAHLDVFAFYLHMYRQIPDKFAKEQNWKKV
jgi:hypothetical protein